MYFNLHTSLNIMPIYFGCRFMYLQQPNKLYCVFEKPLNLLKKDLKENFSKNVYKKHPSFAFKKFSSFQKLFYLTACRKLVNLPMLNFPGQYTVIKLDLNVKISIIFIGPVTIGYSGNINIIGILTLRLILVTV